MSIGALLGLVWLLGASPAANDEAPAGDLSTKRSEAAPGSIEDLYYKGAAHYSAADYGEAIARFTEALDLAGRQGTDPSVRAALLFNLARAHTRAYAVDGDARHLRQAMDIHRRFIEEAQLLGLEVPDQVAASEAEIAEIQAQLDELTASQSETDPQTPSDGSSEASADADARPASKRRVRGIALTVSGAVGLGGGVGIAIFGTSFRRDALQVVDQIDDPPEQEQVFVDDETAKGRIWIGVGAATAAVGTGLLIWGIVDLLAAKKTRRAVAAPWLGPGQAGLALGGRF